MEPGVVSLYICRKCSVRMFLQDCAGHFHRCYSLPQAEYQAVPSRFFIRGPRTQHARPGDGYLSVYQAAGQKVSRRACYFRAQVKRTKRAPDDDVDAELAETD